MINKRHRTIRRAGANLVGVIGSYFIDAWAGMYALALLHRQAHGVPPFGFWAVFWSIATIRFVADSIVSIAQRAKK